MKSHTLFHMIFLLCAVALSYILSRTLGSTYDLELTAGLFALYFIARRLTPQKHFSSGLSSHQLLDSVLFTLICMNIVLTTGGLKSPFFFLVYFLLFALGLMLEPIVSLTTALGIVAVFLPYLPLQASYIDLMPLVALPFLVPFAVFLGSEYRKREKERQAYASLAAENTSKQQDALLFISTVVRGHLKSIGESVDNFHGDHELSAIRTAARRLQKLIDKFEQSY